MKVVQINSTCNSGSTGRIAYQISELLNAENIENYILYSMYESDYPQAYKFCSRNRQLVNAVKSRLLGNMGFEDRFATKKLIKKLNEIKPDILHIHNIASHDVNFTKLFNYLKNNHIKVIWTLHDCFAFTGGCMYFDFANCDKWKTECHHCPKKKEFSWFFDRSKSSFYKKKELLKGLDLTLVTPSNWLADLVKQSFLKDYEVKVINNGIDLTKFKPVVSNFQKEYDIGDKKVLLFSSFNLDERKGIRDIIKLSQMIDHDKYVMVLVGHIEDKYLSEIDKRTILITQTKNQQELKNIYNAATFFINTTYEDNYPTTHMEALACGVPVVTYRTGGSTEMLDESCSYVIEKGDVDGLLKLLNTVDLDKSMKANCIEKSKAFDSNECFRKYIDLYKKIK